MNDPTLDFDYHNAIIIKMKPKLSKTEMVLFSILDSICKGNKKGRTCSLSIKELTPMIAARMPGHSVSQEAVKRCRKKLNSRGLLIRTGTWNRRPVFTTMQPRAADEGYRGIQIPAEVLSDPNLGYAAKLIFGRIMYPLSTGMVYLDWTNQRLVDDLNLGINQIKIGLAQLKEGGYILVHGSKSRFRRIGLNPDWQETRTNNLPYFKNIKGVKKNPVEQGKGVKKNPVDFQESIGIIRKNNGFQGPNKYLKDNKYDSPSENQYQTEGLVTGAEGLSCPRDKISHPIKSGSLENPESNVPRSVHNSKGKEVVDMSRSVDRVLQHWNSKGAPLTKHRPGGTTQYRRIVSATEAALRGTSEKTILAAIDLYHQSLLNPSLTLYRYRNIQPTKVSLDEFFGFSVESLNMINVYKIESLKGIKSWFELMRRGEQVVKDKFGIVPDDRYPVVTDLLKKAISSWDRHPVIVGNEAEKQLRKASGKLVELHQRVKPRIIAWRRIVKISTPEFLREYLVPYILNNLNLEQFRLYWLMSDKFLYNFERHLEEINVVARPTMVRHKLKKRARDCDQDISFRGRGRTFNHHGYDCERDLSAADF